MSLHSIKSEFLYEDARIRKNRNLPHLDVPLGVYFITFNLADALPHHVRERLKRRRAEIRQAIDKARGTSAFHEVDQIRRLFLDECERELDQGHGKSYSSKEFNRMLGRSGQLWQEDYFDRTIRTREELGSTIEYVVNNPSAAGLANLPWVGVGEKALARAVGHL